MLLDSLNTPWKIRKPLVVDMFVLPALFNTALHFFKIPGSIWHSTLSRFGSNEMKLQNQKVPFTGVLQNSYINRKKPVLGSLFNKVVGLKALQLFSCEYYEIFKKIFYSVFIKHLWRLLLQKVSKFWDNNRIHF